MSGIGKKWKIIICLVVVMAAATVLAYGVMQKAEAKSDLGQNALGIDNEINQTDLWGNPIDSLAYLSQVISQKDTVFLYLPIKGQELDEIIKKEIQSAAGKVQSRGGKVAFFALDEGSKDYAQLTSQVPAPFVLVMVKGCNLSAVPANISEERGMRVVSGDISEENLLYALVGASWSSTGCCPPPSNKSSSTKCC